MYLVYGIVVTTQNTVQVEKFNSFLNENRLSVALFAIGFVLLLAGYFSTTFSEKPKELPKESIVQKTEGFFKVDLSGAISKPGVYTIEEGARIEDVISSAGGFTSGVNKEYISKSLNLAQKVSDGQKIYIPFEGENAPQISGGQVAGISTGKVSLNSGSQTDLESLPGVGPATASKIISNRPYSEINDLLNKKAVSKSVFEKIKDSIDLN